MKLHIGCGTVYREGWINIDNNSDNNITKLDLNWDVRNPLPYEDNTIDFISSEHFIEHLPIHIGLHFLRECKRVLKIGGVTRTSSFDLSDLIYAARADNYNWKQDIGAVGIFANVQTRAEFFNLAFYNWGHQYLYTVEEMIRRYKESGFTQIQACKIQESQHKELRNLETRYNSTMCVEATK